MGRIKKGLCSKLIKEYECINVLKYRNLLPMSDESEIIPSRRHTGCLT